MELSSWTGQPNEFVKNSPKMWPNHFLPKLIYNWYREKIQIPKICANSVIFETTARSKQSPNRRKLAQSGHAGLGRQHPHNTNTIFE
jgi:hypothetical protein